MLLPLLPALLDPWSPESIHSEHEYPFRIMNPTIEQHTCENRKIKSSLCFYSVQAGSNAADTGADTGADTMRGDQE